MSRLKRVIDEVMSCHVEEVANVNYKVSLAVLQTMNHQLLLWLKGIQMIYCILSACSIT